MLAARPFLSLGCCLRSKRACSDGHAVLHTTAAAILTNATLLPSCSRWSRRRLLPWDTFAWATRGSPSLQWQQLPPLQPLRSLPQPRQERAARRRRKQRIQAAARQQQPLHQASAQTECCSRLWRRCWAFAPARMRRFCLRLEKRSASALEVRALGLNAGLSWRDLACFVRFPDACCRTQLGVAGCGLPDVRLPDLWMR